MSEVEVIGMGVAFDVVDKHLDGIRKAVNEALQGAGIECQAEAKRHCPVDTGRLRSSILYYSPKELEVKVGTNVFYSQFIEFGHKSRSGRFVAAKAFLFPAFEIARKHLLEELNSL